uniref:Uncharacterized protein n=1 Tax=Pipistrellus kuhlii TaxID=59472 RepID=A0A7J7Y9B4_PIPKU|nr:hypothetical protein mPipKuh1_010354 [Pipistrellus kuhlii]
MGRGGGSPRPRSWGLWEGCQGRNFLHEVKPGLSNFSSGPRPAAAGRAGVGPWDSPVTAEPGALPAAVLGPHAPSQEEALRPGGATVSLAEPHHLAAPRFPFWHPVPARKAVLRLRGLMRAEPGQVLLPRGGQKPPGGAVDRAAPMQRAQRALGESLPSASPGFPRGLRLGPEQECSSRQELLNCD